MTTTMDNLSPEDISKLLTALAAALAAVSTTRGGFYSNQPMERRLVLKINTLQKLIK